MAFMPLGSSKRLLEGLGNIQGRFRFAAFRVGDLATWTAFYLDSPLNNDLRQNFVLLEKQ